MNGTQRMGTQRICILLAVVTLLTGLSTTGWCEVFGTVMKRNNQGSASGSLRFIPSQRKYVITDKNGVSIEIMQADVETVNVKDPPELAAEAKLVQGGQGALAIPNLETIVKNYGGFGPDTRAARWLAEAYQKTGAPGKAVEMCERVIASNPKAAGDPDMAAIYWQGLMDANLIPKLKKALSEAIAQGPRPLVAKALMARGDIAKKEGAPKDALVDGYLRVIVLFQDIKEAQPEALYNAVKCFEQLNQGPYAERMRKKLLAEYPDDPYSERMKSGS